MISVMATFREGLEHLRHAECVRAAQAAHLVKAGEPLPVKPIPPEPDVETCSLEDLFLYFTRGLFLGYKGHPWTRDVLLTLGRVFIRVHRRLPQTRDLAREHSMPSGTALRTHFGCLSGYNAALRRLLEKEDGR